MAATIDPPLENSGSSQSSLLDCTEVTQLDYVNKIILAPMVRVCTLPMRLLALEYGADIVYCEEIIDFKILSSKRIENAVLGTVDYVLSDKTVVFRTHPSEKSRLVFQLGTSDAKRALHAARKVEQDVSGIDVNMGCPKEFSIKGGMGAALLTQPEKVKDILTTLVNGLSIPVTCKIRVLPQIEDTLALVKLIESTGVRALAVHGRIKEERPRHPNRNHVIRKIAETVSLPVIANGGSKEILTYKDIEKFREDTGASSVMIARAAEYNPSIFRVDGKLDLFQVIRRYLRICIDCDNEFTNTKYCILMMMREDMDKQEGLDTQDSKSMEEVCDIWSLGDYRREVLLERHKKKEDVDKCHGIKRRKLEDGMILIEMPIRFIRKDYPISISPKLKLYEWAKKNSSGKPQYDTAERKEDRCYKCILELEDKKYTITDWEKSKQLAEQGAAIVALTVLGEPDGRKPNTDSPNDEIARVWREQFQMNDMNIYKHKTEDCGKHENDSKNRTEMESNADMIEIKGNECDIQENGLTDCDSGVADIGDNLPKEGLRLNTDSVVNTDLMRNSER